MLAPAAGRVLTECLSHVAGDRRLRPRGDDRVLDALDVHERPSPVAAGVALERHEREHTIGPYVLAVPEGDQL